MAKMFGHPNHVQLATPPQKKELKHEQGGSQLNMVSVAILYLNQNWR